MKDKDVSKKKFLKGRSPLYYRRHFLNVHELGFYS